MASANPYIKSECTTKNEATCPPASKMPVTVAYPVGYKLSQEY